MFFYSITFVQYLVNLYVLKMNKFKMVYTNFLFGGLMSEDQKKDLVSDQAINEIDSEDPPDYGEANPEDQRKVRGDRRVIKRFSDKRVYGHLKLTLRWIHVLMVLLVGWGVYLLYINILKGQAGIGPAIFWTTLISLSMVPLIRYRNSVKFYLENESVNNLENCIEKQTSLMMMMVFVFVLFTVVSMV